LQQELAADAAGAQFAGGRHVYLRALARLALTQDDSLCSWPVRAFLPARGTLLRRIAMLRTEEGKPGRSWPRWLAAVALGVIVVGVSALRGPVRAEDKPAAKIANTESTPQAPAAAEKQPQRVPFEYCWCARDAAGFYAFRPSVYFGCDPKMKRYA